MEGTFDGMTKWLRRRWADAAVLRPIDASSDVDLSTACAIVPLYPNELTPPASPPPTLPTCVASTLRPPRITPPTRGLAARSCAFGGASARSRPTASRTRPVRPAAGSA
eukprot:7390354-Prymnesium_polylepis.2